MPWKWTPVILFVVAVVAITQLPFALVEVLQK